ncbi:hypothetical protein GCK32_016697 [Trichostrongylus colubriformis]|uniref:Uncharacterized protein n=1 Tax=Trichostrongylus colubriformis TaxID=6319 RepID=A0AAN8G571_TRICO
MIGMNEELHRTYCGPVVDVRYEIVGRSDERSLSREVFQEMEYFQKKGYSDRAGRAFASPKLYKEEKMKSKDAEETMGICLHRCLESIKVRDAIKQADPQFFNSLVAALMRA